MLSAQALQTGCAAFDAVTRDLTATGTPPATGPGPAVPPPARSPPTS
ncbi:hypothetical protein [Streptomyces tibetensis]